MIEKLILSHLTLNEAYARKVLPFLRDSYFRGTDQKLYSLISDFYNNYNAPPSKEALLVEVGKLETLTEDQFKEAKKTVDELALTNDSIEWLVQNTESYCQERALYNAIAESISIMDGKHKVYRKEAIPQLLSDALGVSFDTVIGHSYLDDAESRYEYYHRRESRIAFDIGVFNDITNGGLPPKTLNVILAGTGVGKSQFMCHMAANNLLQNRNVLYITAEMAEEEIAKRIDANLLDVDISEIHNISKSKFDRLVAGVRERTTGKLHIKEYPTSSAGANHFRHLLNELRLKKSFKPDIIYIDYLNICASSRLKSGKNSSYEYVKAIAEELRGLAIEFCVPIVTATQLTRSGYASSDPDLTDTSESFGLPATADCMWALIQNEELAEMNQIMVKQLKNRYRSPDYKRKFLIGVDRGHMRFFQLDSDAGFPGSNTAPTKWNSSSSGDSDTPLFDMSQRRSGFSDFKYGDSE